MNSTNDRTTSADIVSATAEFVAALFRNHSDQLFPFHNYRHTTEVVQAAREIGMGEGLSREELEIVTIAAWLHDVGYFQSYRGHEEKSAETAETHLRGHDYPDEKIGKVVACIMATRYPQKPTNILEQVICDADMAHLGGDNAEEKAEGLRKERYQCYGESYSDLEWLSGNLKFMQDQHYHTGYARETYGPKLQEHVRRTEAEFERLQNGHPENTNGGVMLSTAGTGDEAQALSGEPEQKKSKSLSKGEAGKDRKEERHKEEKGEAKGEKKEKKIKKLQKELQKIQEELEGVLVESGSDGPVKVKANSAARLDRGIETMFKTTSRNHIDLSAMADSKANIMISVNSIIISIVASVLLGKLDTDPHYAVPTVILLGVCLSTIVFSILATRPKVTTGTFTQEDIDAKKVNLLFFGNFHGVELEDYQRGVVAMMNDSDYLYGSMIKDIYFLGQVLGRKYRYLRISYNIFMYGLVIAVLAFIIASVIGPSTSAITQP